MKKFIYIFTFVFLCSTAMATTIHLGEKLTLTKVTKISEINAHPKKYLGKRVLIEGTVIEVCAARGCWVDIASDLPFQKILVKVIDGVIVFPMTAKGRTALVEGIVEVIHLNLRETVEYSQHQAEKRGKKFYPTSVKEPMKLYRIKGLGAVIK
ncbi:MAG: DUF4920 domain-containing protein [Denitrovibrio sp.]|nr:MAG: DUF4920 domain-containing protein [Denitrovibrio sp.]